MILFIGNSRQGKNKMTLRIFLGARVGEGTAKGHKGTFLGGRNILYLDGIYKCINSPNSSI